VSLARLPVDLMPDVSYPSITGRVGYTGVGPLEMEELVTRPIEQAMAAVAGLERLESTSSEGNSRVTLNLAWGMDLNEAADDVRSRIDRVRGRLPEDADPPTVFKFDSNSMPIMSVGVEGDYDRVRLREIAEHDLSQRLERVPASPPSPSRAVCAGRSTSSSRRRRSRARPAGRPRREPAPHREPEHPARRDRRRRPHLPGAQPGAVLRPQRNPRHGRDDPAGRPVYMKDIAR
jgi:hypothetical protein